MLLSINRKSRDKKNRTNQVDLSYIFYVYNVLLHLIMIEYHQTP